MLLCGWQAAGEPRPEPFVVRFSHSKVRSEQNADAANSRDRAVTGVQLGLRARGPQLHQSAVRTPRGVGADDGPRGGLRQQRADLSRGVDVELLQNLRADDASPLGPQLAEHFLRVHVFLAGIHVVGVTASA